MVRKVIRVVVLIFRGGFEDRVYESFVRVEIFILVEFKDGEVKSVEIVENFLLRGVLWSWF